MEMKDSIKKRLNKAFLIIALIGCFGIVICDVSMYVMCANYESAMKNYGFSQGEIGKAMVTFSETRSALRAVIGYKDSSEIADAKNDYQTKKEKFKTYLANIEQYMVTKEGRELYADVNTALDGYWTKSDSILSLGSTSDVGNSEKAQKQEYAELSEMYDTVYNAMVKLMDCNVEKGNSVMLVLEVLKNVICILVILIIIASFTVSRKIGKKISDSIEQPIDMLVDRFKTLSNGGLDEEFPEYEADDEFAVINQTAKEMADSLKLIINDLCWIMAEMADGNFNVNTKIEDKYVGKYVELKNAIRNMNRKINQTLKGVGESSAQVTAGSENLAQSAQDLAQGATEQAGAVEELQATIDTITDQIAKTVDNLEETSRKAERCAEEADTSKVDMHELVEAMNRISETSKKIENIIADIEDIASQTNLLSLNAAIEAARAGEAGKGFAVVAEQIRTLADQSAKSAVDTRELIEGALKEIDEGNTVAMKAVESLDTVVGGINEIAEVSKELSTSSNQQIAAMKEADEGINQISEVVQSNSAASQECSATSEELSAQAEAMNELVSQFVLRSE